MNMISAGRKTWCQRIKAAIILEGVILLMAAFILWENTIRNSAHKVVNEIFTQIPESIPTDKKLVSFVLSIFQKGGYSNSKSASKKLNKRDL